MDPFCRCVLLAMRRFLYIAGSSNQMPNGVEAALQQVNAAEMALRFRGTLAVIAIAAGPSTRTWV